MLNILKAKKIDVVVEPATGSVIIAQGVAYQLSLLKQKEIMSAYAKKEGNDFIFRRGYAKKITGKRVLMVEDVINTGGTVRKIIETVRHIGGKVVGLGAFCNRGEVTANSVISSPKFMALLNIRLKRWEKSKCPLCAAGVSISNDFGRQE